MRIWRWLLGRWRNIRLRNKLVLVVAAAVALMSSVSILASLRMADSYDRLLYEKTADSLAMLSNEIRTDVKAVSSVSDFLATNSGVQQDLARLKAETDPLRRSESITSLRRVLNAYFSYSVYLMGVTLYDEAGNVLVHVGRDNWKPQGALMERVRALAGELAGREGWISTGSDEHGVLCTRMIRRIKNLRLDNLAHMVIQVDMAALAGEALRGVSSGTRLLMESGEGPLYPTGERDWTRLLHEQVPPGSGYHIFHMGGQKVFAVARTLEDYGWTCITAIDYSQVFDSVRLARVMFVSAVLAATVAAVLLTNAIVVSILRHLNRLMRKMDGYASGNPVLPAPDGADYAERGDELGVLHRRFDDMIRRIGQLIEENYVKQLLIQDSRLKALEAQVNPHFLYNTLDSINWQAKASGEKRISEMAEALGGLMRSSLSSSLSGKEDLIPLRAELEIVGNYIRIQRIRYEDRLRYEQRVPRELLGALVPRMSVQPLVDNAVKHALEEVSDLCLIRLSAGREGENVTVTVWNNGSQIDGDVLRKLEEGELAPSGTGVGLLNIDRRVKLLYGPSYGLRFENGEDCVSAIMTVPLRRENHEEHP